MERFPDSRPRHLAAVWIADIVGYSGIAARNEDEALRLIERFQEHAHSAIAGQEGRLVKFSGDGAIAEFASTEAAVLAAQSLRQALEPGVRLRVGVHIGDVYRMADGDLLGDGVNVAARLQAEAAPGEILLSEQVWRHLRHREGFRLIEAGVRVLKGQQEAVPTYRLLREGEEAAAAAAAVSMEPGGQRAAMARWGKVLRRFGPRGVGWAAVVLVLLFLGFFPALGWFTDPGQESVAELDPVAEVSAAELNPARLAVLYFEDRSAGGRMDYLASALTEGLIGELSQIDAIDVISRGGVKPYRGTNTPYDSIARALGAGTLVEGAVALSGSTVRVTAELIDGRTKSVLDVAEVEQDSIELFALQDALVDAVTELLRQKLGREIRKHEVRRGTQNEEAYDLVMRAAFEGEEYSILRMTDAEAAKGRLLEADRLLAQAERLDPEWIEPVLRRGWAARRHSLLESENPGYLEPQLGRRALAHAERAVAMNADDPAALELRGTLRHELAQLERDATLREQLLTGAEQDLRRATQLDPLRARAWGALSQLLVDRAKFEEAKLMAERAFRADGFLENGEDVLYRLYDAAVQLGPTEEARALCDRGRRRYPESDEFILCQLLMLASFDSIQPDLARALELRDSVIEVVPPKDERRFRAFGTMFAAQVAARAGDRSRAETLLRQARGESPIAWLAYNEAQLRLTLGDTTAALDLLELFLEENPASREFVGKDWWFEALRGNTRFQELTTP